MRYWEKRANAFGLSLSLVFFGISWLLTSRSQASNSAAQATRVALAQVQSLLQANLTRLKELETELTRQRIAQPESVDMALAAGSKAEAVEAPKGPMEPDAAALQTSQAATGPETPNRGEWPGPTPPNPEPMPAGVTIRRV